MERGGGNFITNILVRLLADNSEFMERMRAAQHATYDSVRAIKALNATAGGDLNKLLNSTLRNTVSFATRTFSAVASDALDAIAFEENNQMALAALAEYRMKQEAITKLSTQRIQIGTKVLTVEEQLAALERRRMSSINKSGSATLDQINWLNDIKRLQTDIQQSENGIATARARLADTTKALTDNEKQRLTLKIQEYEQKINDITTYQIPKAQEKLAKSGYQPFTPSENQVDWEAMAAQIMAGGDKVVGIFADQMQGLTKDNIAEIKKKADEESRATMDVLNIMAIRSPFSRKEIVEGYGTLVRMGGISFEQGKEMMQQIVDIQAVTGKGNKGIQSMTLAVGKILATGRLNGDAVNQLVKTAGIPVWEILAKSTGKTTAELQKMMRANKLSAEIVMPALQNYMRDFAGKAAEEAGTFVGLVNSIKDIKDSVLVDFFAPIGEAFKRPFQTIVDFLTVGPFREIVRKAGLEIGQDLTKGIDFIYRSIEKFKKLGDVESNPFTRLLIIIKDASKEFNLDTGGIAKFINTLEGVFTWAKNNEKNLIEFGDTVKNVFLTLVAVTSVASVLGKIQMFITGFLASPIGILVLTIAALYTAWTYNFGGIADWINLNGQKAKDFLITFGQEISALYKLLKSPRLSADNFFLKLGQYGLISENFYNSIKKVRTGISEIKKAIGILEESGTPKGALKGGILGIQSVIQGLFTDLLNPQSIAKNVQSLLGEVSKFLDPSQNPQISVAILGIFYSAGSFIGTAIQWLLDTLGRSLLSADSLSKIMITIGNALYNILIAIGGFIIGFFKIGPKLGNEEGIYSSIGNTIVSVIFRAVGSVAGLLALGAGAAISGVLNAIISFVQKVISPETASSAVESVEKQSFIESLAETIYNIVITPFKEAFKSDKLEEYNKYIKSAFNLIFTPIKLLYTEAVYDVATTISENAKPVLNILNDVAEAINRAIMKIAGKTDEEIEAAVKNMKENDPLNKFFKTWPEETKKARDAALAEMQKLYDNNGQIIIPKAPTFFGTPPPQATSPIPIPYQYYPTLGPGAGPLSDTPPARIDQGQVINYVKEVKRVAEESITPLSLPVVFDPEQTQAAISVVKNQIERDRFPFPIEIVLPQTGADLTGQGGKEGFYKEDFANNIIKQAGLDALGPEVSLAVFNNIKDGINNGISTASEQIYANKNSESIPGYQEIGVVQGNAISAGLIAGLEPSTTAINGLNGGLIAITESSLPTLKTNLDDWRLDMTSRVGPEIDNVRTTVIDPLKGSFDAVGAAVDRLSDKLGLLQLKFASIKIPDQLTANSPTPFELGLRGISKATDQLNRKKIPSIFTKSPNYQMQEARIRNIKSGNNKENLTSINLVVKVGEKEVAGAVATAVAGELKKIIYRDTLRG